MKDIPAELLAALRELIRYAVMTLAAVRDPDARYLGWSKLPANIVHDVQEAYGYSTPWVRSFRPSPRDIEQMEIILPWLAWVRREEGETAIRRIFGWAMGAALWRLGQREQCSDATIVNRINRSVSAIILKFAGVDVPVCPIDEPYKGAVYAMIFEKPPGPHGEAEILIKKVYVADRGFWKNGKRLRNGQENYDLEKLSA
jgi:hypothetical protein